MLIFGHDRERGSKLSWNLVVWARIQIFFFFSHQFIWHYRHLLAIWGIAADSRFISELVNFSSQVYFGICSIVVVMDVRQVLSHRSDTSTKINISQRSVFLGRHVADTDLWWRFSVLQPHVWMSKFFTASKEQKNDRMKLFFCQFTGILNKNDPHSSYLFIIRLKRLLLLGV